MLQTLQGDEALPAPVIELCDRLRDSAADLDLAGVWPEKQVQWCAAAGVFRWFIPEEFGGWGWNEQRILAGYLALSQSCLTTTFVLTQWNAACRRILASHNEAQKQFLLPKMAEGEIFATVGLSHLTTSRQYLAQPVLVAELMPDGGLILNGYSPWVTGAPAADVIVIGATLLDGRQAICAMPTSRSGVSASRGQSLVALNASATGQVELTNVEIAHSEILSGPVQDVMQVNAGGGAGGLQTSTLAIGLAMAAVDFIRQQSESRANLLPIYEKLHRDTDQLHRILVELTSGGHAMTPSELRQRANSLVLRATQAALSAAKGAGFAAAHPAGRMAREALFFLVWSCPQPVVAANLCELAQLG